MEDASRITFTDISTGMLVVGYSDGKVSTFLLEDFSAALDLIEAISTSHNLESMN